MRQCDICGKRPVRGHAITHRGMLKVKGGVGRRTVRVNLRRFLPNLRSAKVIQNGTIKRIRVCTACLRSGRIQRVGPTPSRPSA